MARVMSLTMSRSHLELREGLQWLVSFVEVSRLC